MAVIPEQPQLQVYVECNGQRLPEFDADENDTDTTTAATTKHIESQSGAEFAVQFELHRPFPQYALRIQLYIDGKRTHSRIIGNVQYQRAQAILNWTIDNVKSKTADGQSIMQKFCFSELRIEDLDDTDLGVSFIDNQKSMGTITLKAFHISHFREIPLKANCLVKDERVEGERVENSQPELGPIPEKALKGEALTHSTKLGPPINLPCTSSSRTNSYHTRPTRTIYSYVHPQRLPFAVFNFKYRSRAALQSLLIIPRSPRPSPPQVKDEDKRVDCTTELKREVPVATIVKEESRLKREHSIVAVSDDDEVVFVSATKQRKLKEEPSVKREHLAMVAGDEDKKDFVFVSETNVDGRTLPLSGMALRSLISRRAWIGYHGAIMET